jgi:hypothetical protein
VHLFRSVPPVFLSEQLGQFDDEFREAMESITGKVSEFTWSFMGLGCKMGGLGLRPARLHALGGYLASFSTASLWIKARFSAIPEGEIDERVEFLSTAWSRAFGDLPASIGQHSLSVATDKVLLPLLTSSPACPPANWVASIQSPSSSCFWKCLPSRWNGTYIDNACFRVLVQLRYRIPQLYASPCPAVGWTADLDVFSDHALCCKKGGEPTIRHNRLAQRLAMEFSRAVAGVSLEARLLLQKSDERPADIFLTAWRGGAHALDVTVPHVITKTTPSSAQGLFAMEQAMSRKQAKYLERCKDRGLGFSVLAFDTLGATHPVTATFLKAMFKDAKRRELCPDWKSVPQAWNRVIVPLQVDVARQILSRSVAPSLDALSTPVFVPPAVAGVTITVELEALPPPTPFVSLLCTTDRACASLGGASLLASPGAGTLGAPLSARTDYYSLAPSPTDCARASLGGSGLLASPGAGALGSPSPPTAPTDVLSTLGSTATRTGHRLLTPNARDPTTSRTEVFCTTVPDDGAVQVFSLQPCMDLVRTPSAFYHTASSEVKSLAVPSPSTALTKGSSGRDPSQGTPGQAVLQSRTTTAAGVKDHSGNEGTRVGQELCATPVPARATSDPGNVWDVAQKVLVGMGRPGGLKIFPGGSGSAGDPLIASTPLPQLKPSSLMSDPEFKRSSHQDNSPSCTSFVGSFSLCSSGRSSRSGSSSSSKSKDQGSTSSSVAAVPRLSTPQQLERLGISAEYLEQLRRTASLSWMGSGSSSTDRSSDCGCASGSSSSSGGCSGSGTSSSSSGSGSGSGGSGSSVSGSSCGGSGSNSRSGGKSTSGSARSSGGSARSRRSSGSGSTSGGCSGGSGHSGSTTTATSTSSTTTPATSGRGGGKRRSKSGSSGSGRTSGGCRSSRRSGGGRSSTSASTAPATSSSTPATAPCSSTSTSTSGKAGRGRRSTQESK